MLGETVKNNKNMREKIYITRGAWFLYLSNIITRNIYLNFVLLRILTSKKKKSCIPFNFIKLFNKIDDGD